MSVGRLPRKGSDHFLPEETYRMVQHFCYSYGEMRKELLSIDGLRSPVIDDMPHGTGTSNPTESLGIRRAEIGRKMRIIEDAVNATSPEARYWLFLSVTDKTKPWNVLAAKHGCPYNRKAFGAMKREVYWRVAKKI